MGRHASWTEADHPAVKGSFDDYEPGKPVWEAKTTGMDQGYIRELCEYGILSALPARYKNRKVLKEMTGEFPIQDGDRIEGMAGRGGGGKFCIFHFSSLGAYR